MVDRLFQMVYLLIEKKQMTAKELAEMFEVSERTIYRDLDKLTLAGVPVYTNKGKNGGISILSDYVLDKAVLTSEEKSRIFEALNAWNEVDFQKNDMSSKIRNFFGERYQDWLEIEFSGWGDSEEDAKRFAQIKDAVLERRLIEIVYSGNNQMTTRRRVKPLKICFKDQAWYLYGYCCLKEDYRFFKLKRISELLVLKESFPMEKVGKVLEAARKKYQAGDKRMRATVAIDPKMAYRAYDELSGVTMAEDGRLRCTIVIDEIEWFVSYVLSFGPYMQVLEPAEVREQVISALSQMQSQYSSK